MKASRLARVMSFALATTALGGCYVVPIDGRYPALPQPALPAAAAALAPATLNARLYPLNDAAGKMGPLSAVVTDHANGHASFSVQVSGEAMQGEASRVPVGYPGFGKVHGEVYGDARMPAGQRGIASAAGARGTYVNCEYALTGVNRGTGACLFSNGAKYQLHFGS